MEVGGPGMEFTPARQKTETQLNTFLPFRILIRQRKKQDEETIYCI